MPCSSRIGDALTEKTIDSPFDGARPNNRPVIAVRWTGEPMPLADARRACDQLQRDLAPHGDYAGYFV